MIVVYIFCVCISSVFALSFDDLLRQNIKPFIDFLYDIVFYNINIFNVSLPIIVLWLFLASIIFSVLLKGIQITGIKKTIAILKKNPANGGGVTFASSFYSYIRHNWSW